MKMLTYPQNYLPRAGVPRYVLHILLPTRLYKASLQVYTPTSCTNNSTINIVHSSSKLKRLFFSLNVLIMKNTIFFCCFYKTHIFAIDYVFEDNILLQISTWSFYEFILCVIQYKPLDQVETEYQILQSTSTCRVLLHLILSASSVQ